MKRKCGVYQIACTKNNKIYIGSSKNILSRWKHHTSELNRNCHGNMFLQEDWNKYGQDNFKFTILEETKIGNRYDVEQEYFKLLMPFYRTCNGYNISEKSTKRNNISMRIRRGNDYGDYYIVKKKRNPIRMLLDYDDYKSKTRDEIEFEYDGYCEYQNIKEYILEMGGYDDDWS